MSEAIFSLFSTTGFMPHGHCFLWTPSLLWLYVTSDLVIGAAYYSIPLALVYFVSKRHDLQFNWIFVLFSVFIFACGTTHLISILTIWRPVYWLDAAIKAATASVSMLTAMLLWPLIPKALRLPSPARLQAVITQMEYEASERRQAETALAQLNETLELRVAARTAELQASNEQLATEIESRKCAEENLQAALEEKITLLAEVHHRVKNNLQIVHSLLDLQSTQTQDPTVRAMLKNSMSRIQSMSLIHQTVYQSKSFARVALNEVLNTLVSNIAMAHGVDENRVKVAIDVKSVALPITQAIPCGLIINELVTNALKYAFPDGRSGAVRVELMVADDAQVTLAVCDDGVGLPPDIDLDNLSSLGLELVAVLADQIGGELTIQLAHPTQFVVRFALRSE